MNPSPQQTHRLTLGRRDGEGVLHGHNWAPQHRLRVAQRVQQMDRLANILGVAQQNVAERSPPDTLVTSTTSQDKDHS